MAALSVFNQGVSVNPATVAAGDTVFGIGKGITPTSFMQISLDGTSNSSTTITNTNAANTITSKLLLSTTGNTTLSNGLTATPGTVAITTAGAVNITPPTGQITTITNPTVSGALTFNAGSSANFANATVTNLPIPQLTEYTVLFNAANGGLSTFGAIGTPVNFGSATNATFNALTNQGGSFLCLINGTQNGTSPLNTTQTSSVWAIVRPAGVAGICNSLANVNGAFGEQFTLAWSAGGQLSLTMGKLSGTNVWVVGTVYTAHVTFVTNSTVSLL